MQNIKHKKGLTRTGTIPPHKYIKVNEKRMIQLCMYVLANVVIPENHT